MNYVLLAGSLKNQLLKMSLTVIAVIAQFSDTENALQQFIQSNCIAVTLALGGISLVGIGVSVYIITLRQDAILYARTINSIRKFFYDNSMLDHLTSLQTRGLPQTQRLPRYFEISYFLPVVVVFAIINSAYELIALWVSSDRVLWFHFILFFVLYLAMQIAGYYCMSEYRERDYMRSNIMGIDIDGVLNHHRQHFCDMLEEKTGKHLNPSEIIRIPVHEIEGINVTRDDEREVFNDPKYWTEMPAVEGASRAIKSMKNTLDLKIYIFSYRAWPDGDPPQIFPIIESFIEDCAHKTLLCKYLARCIGKEREKGKGRRGRRRKFIHEHKEAAIKQLTKEWLENNQIRPNKFFLERGNDFSSDPKIHLRNRFYIASKMKIRYFVEDDLEKAIKLAYICDTVFLYRQPYNSPDTQAVLPIDSVKSTELPANIILVESWEEIKRIMRAIS